MSDPNRRQELTEILSDMRSGVNCFGDTAERIIYEALTKAIDLAQGLPSEQPETHDKRTETHACDLISRQAAIEALIVRDPNCGIDGANVIKGLPSAQPDYQEVLGWLLAYHTKSFDLHGRHLPHEVISWLINDFTKDFIAERGQDG